MNNNLTPAQEQAFISQYSTYTVYGLEEQYDNMLDECYDDIDVAGLNFSPSRVLEAVDPIAYQCRLNDYTAANYTELSNGDYALSSTLEEFLDSWEG